MKTETYGKRWQETEIEAWGERWRDAERSHARQERGREQGQEMGIKGRSYGKLVRDGGGEEHRRGRASKHRRRAGDSPRHTTGFRDTARVQEPLDIFEAPWQKSDQQMGRFSENRGSPTLLLNS